MRVMLLLALVFAAESVSAQVPQLQRAGLPGDVADRLEAVIDDPATVRYDGIATIEEGEVIAANVYATGGLLRVAGTVQGQLIVVYGDVVFDPGAEVFGDVTVVGGSASGLDGVSLGGTFTEYGEGFGLIASAERLHDGRSRWVQRDWDWRDDLGHVDLDVRVGENYNRIEGLPLMFGPSIRTGGSSPTRLEALAIWRTAAGSLGKTERMGYMARAEQFLGPHVRLGVAARSVIQPLDAWSVSNLEASLAAALFHDDQRDYFEREGWSAYMRVAPRRSPVDLLVEYRDEEHWTAAVRDPWTLFDGDETWRLQPIAAEGRLRSLTTALELDMRRGRDFVPEGWWFRVEATRGIEGELITPELAISSQTVVPATVFDSDFTVGMVDARRYSPIGWDGSLAIRVVGGGTLDEAPLAPQFQHALGGAGSMPGYDLLSVDCGARATLGTLETGVGGGGQSFFGGYGCDRFAMVQAEYRGGFDIRFGHDDDHRWRHFDANVDWTVFFDAAIGYRYDDAGNRFDTGALYDAGMGVILGDFGVYGAVPLTGDDRGLRMFIRLGPRF